MATRYIKAIVCILSIGGLTACQNMFAQHPRMAAASMENVDLSSYFAQRLAEGRNHLQANRPGAAIVAYRQASYDPDLRPAAYNGMAIAFDTIGRADLAQQYFMAAIELAPENVSFASNFLHFTQSHTPQSDGATGLAESELPALPEVLADLTDMVPESGGIMRRVSQRDVHIAASGEQQVRATPPQAATITVESRARTGNVRPTQYPVRFALADVDQEEVNAQANVTVESRRSAPRPRMRRPAGPPNRAYPIRVYLGQS